MSFEPNPWGDPVPAEDQPSSPMADSPSAAEAGLPAPAKDDLPASAGDESWPPTAAGSWSHAAPDSVSPVDSASPAAPAWTGPTYAETPAEPSEAAPAVPFAPPPAPAVAPASPAGPRLAAGTLGLVVAAALMSAVLAGGGTAALLLGTRPAATATPIAAPTAAPATSAINRIDGADAIAAVAAATEPSVVTISGSSGRLGATGGSGIVVSADGLILTTAIVAPRDATYDILLADQHETTARVVASDAAHGLVLLRAETADLTPAQLGDGKIPTVGQLVVAVGSPLGQFTDTVTSGIVSGLDRSIDQQDPSSGIHVALQGLIQTDAAINAGSSGGPLLDAAGTVVGVIATSANDGQGIGFAIPIAVALELIARAGA